jgi:hypothetical protein
MESESSPEISVKFWLNGVKFQKILFFDTEDVGSMLFRNTGELLYTLEDLSN